MSRSEGEFLVWDTVSMAWTEIGIFDNEYPKIAGQLREHFSSWDEIAAIIDRDVVPAFSVRSALLLLILAPPIGLLLITPMPDWGYEEAWLRKRIARWHAWPLWLHWCNPARIVGYPIAFLFSIALRQRLKRAWHASSARPAADVTPDIPHPPPGTSR